MFKKEAARLSEIPSVRASRCTPGARSPISAADLGGDFRHDFVDTRNRHQSYSVLVHKG